MKELNIEEKAQRYDEAIERAKKVLLDCTPEEQKVVEYISPELKESDGEKIRKKLLSSFKGIMADADEDELWYGLSYNDIIAWLEKQSTTQVRTGLEWVNTIDEACDKRYSEEYAHGEYCHKQSFKWGFQEGVDWLEKRGESKLPEDLGEYIAELSKQFPEVSFAKLSRIAVRVKNWLEKQGEKGTNGNEREIPNSEQKPDDKVEPFDKYEGLTDFERTLADICIGWIGEELGWKQYIKDNADVLLKIAIKKFNSVQDAIFEKKPAEISQSEVTKTSDQVQKPAEWSDEDEAGLSDALWAIQQARAIAKDENDMGNLWYAENWLKSIKDRVQPQPKQKWSEEDEKIINKLIAVVELYYGKGKGNDLNKQRCLSWLKSLRPQKQWKPTKEQMATLEFYMVTLFPNKDKEVLFGLYSDLKQL